MGRRETVIYECDWCGATAPEDTSGYGPSMPKDWGYAAHCGDDTLCPECHKEREYAIAQAKVARQHKSKESNG